LLARIRNIFFFVHLDGVAQNKIFIVISVAASNNRPLDFVTLSACLWHRSVLTTMKYYAGRLNPSVSTAIAEELFERMQTNSSDTSIGRADYEASGMLVAEMKSMSGPLKYPVA
jgi:hypothetical protein